MSAEAKLHENQLKKYKKITQAKIRQNSETACFDYEQTLILKVQQYTKSQKIPPKSGHFLQFELYRLIIMRSW